MVEKEALRKKFAKEWKKHYQVEALTSKGYKRRVCKKCGVGFWTLDAGRDVCADSSCIGYEFIGKPTKRLEYVETWQEIEKYFKRKGHTPIKRYPTVCRWRDDLYFTNASIIDFQPYVVGGEVEPPANPLVIPQACLRFGDIGNVGVTGAHYTSFIMFGQHAFNSKKSGTFYWKNEAIEHDFNYVKNVLGAKEKDIVFQEQVWSGGGSFGPSLEYCVNGLELGNCVFMQFAEKPNGGYEELKIKVIDMGAGLERLAWFTNGSATSYETTFGAVIEALKKENDLRIEKRVFEKFARLSGSLNLDEAKSIERERKRIAAAVGVSEEELFKVLEPLQALYAVCDHLKAILYTATDGMLPSNSGGGYNLRLILRRVFGFEKELGLKLDFAKIIEGHAKHLEALDSSLMEGVSTAIELVEEEKRKYVSSMEKGRKRLEVIVERARGKGSLPEKELRQLYESDGIPAELVKEVAGEKGVKVQIPQDFYTSFARKAEKVRLPIVEMPGKGFQKTRLLFHEMPFVDKFTARVLGTIENYVVLDKTLFYAEAGGQVSDIGWLNGEKVSDVQGEWGVLLHKVKNPQKFKRGLKVEGEIDWQRRHNLMRHHTATHLLNAAARELLGRHVWQAGALKEEGKAHLDLTHFKRITQEEMAKLEALVNKMVQDNVEVKSFSMDRGKAEQEYGFRIYQGGFVPGKTLRIVEVKGLDVEACGGTHVKSTGEIGFFKIVKREGVKDGVERISFKIGIPALEFVQMEERVLAGAAESLGVPWQGLEDAAKRFFGEWRQAKKELRKGSETLAEASLGRILREQGGNEIRACVEGLKGKGLVSLGERIVNERPEAEAVLVSGDEILVMEGEKSGKNADETLKGFLLKCGGRGGGSKKIARGIASDSNKAREEIQKL